MKKNIKKNFNKFLIAGSSFLVAVPAFALVAAPTSVADFVKIINCLALDVVPVIVLLAFIIFVAGLVGYVGSGDNEEKREQGRSVMIYGLIGFFVMVSIWGILGIVTNSFGKQVLIPQFKGSGSVQDVSSCSN